MMKYQMIKHIETIKEWSTMNIQFNLMKWGDAPAKYDIRKWEGNEPRKGVSLSKEEAEILLMALSKELGFNCEKKQDKSTNTEEDTKKEIIASEIDYRNFIVHSNMSDCEKEHHDYEDIKAVVPIYSHGTVKTIEFPARFCRTCKAYYISEYTYTMIERQGRLLCQVASLQEYREYKKASIMDNLKPQHVLNIIGYNVDSKNDLSEEHRRTVLMYAIEEGVVTRNEAIKHIGFLIKLNEKNPGKRNAIAKWEADRAFLKGYSVGAKKLVGVNKVIKEV